MYDNTVECIFLDLLYNIGNCLWKLACEVIVWTLDPPHAPHVQELIKWILLGCITNDVFVYKCGYVLHFTPSPRFATPNIS